MRSFKKKEKWQSFLYSKPVLAVLAIILAIFAWNVIVFTGKMRITKENRVMAEDKVAELEKEKAKLSSDIAKLDTEEGMEESIRERFGYVKEGESLIVVVENKNTARVESSTEKTGFLSFLRSLFR